MKVTKSVPLSVGALSVPIFIELFLLMLLGNVDQFMLSQYAETAVAGQCEPDYQYYLVFAHCHEYSYHHFNRSIFGS